MRLLAITLGIFIINNGYAVAATMRGYHIAAAGTTAWDVDGSTGSLRPSL